MAVTGPSVALVLAPRVGMASAERTAPPAVPAAAWQGTAERVAAPGERAARQAPPAARPRTAASTPRSGVQRAKPVAIAPAGGSAAPPTGAGPMTAMPA